MGLGSSSGGRLRRLFTRAAAPVTAGDDTGYYALAMSIPVGILRRDMDGRAKFANRHLLDIAGLPSDSTFKDVAFTIVHPDDREVGVAAMQRTLRTGEPYERELRVLRPSGEIRFVTVRGSVDVDSDGEPAGYLATMIDVTDRHAAEQAVRTSERAMRTLMMAMPAGIVRMDAAGKWLLINDGLRELWHLGPEEELGSFDWSAALHPDDRQRVIDDWGAAVRGDGTYEAEFRIVGPNGLSRWTWARAIAEHDESGARVGFLATVQDVEVRHGAEEALSRSERLYRLTVNNLPGVLIGLYDRELRCVLMEGDGTTEQLSTKACAGLTLEQFANVETADMLTPGMRAALDGVEESYAYHSPRDDSYRENHVGPLRTAEGEIDGVVIVSRDVTEFRAADAARRVADEQFRIAFDYAPIGIVDFELSGRLGRVNQALVEMTGYDTEALLGMRLADVVYTEDVAEVEASLGAIGRASDTVSVEHRIVHADGHVMWVDTRLALIRDAQGAPMRSLAQIQDISARRENEERLLYLADHDPLTGLLNRRGFERELDTHLAADRRYERGGTLAVLDLDGFKQVNDTLGHAAGDAVIVGVAAALTERLRESDIIARLGGDEFAVLLPTQDSEHAEIVAKSLLDVIRRQTSSIGSITASIGLAPVWNGALPAELLGRADAAMYEAKAGGRDRYALHPGRVGEDAAGSVSEAPVAPS